MRFSICPRSRSGRLILSEDEFNVGELLQDLVVMMQPEIKNKQQTLNIHVKNLRHENVKGDTQRIKQVLMNILSNAIKYTPENGRITIEIYEKAPHNGIGNYQFVFEDNGRGMKPEFLDKIFEPFERASDDEIKRIQGTGLGMSISHKIIQMMGEISRWRVNMAKVPASPSTCHWFAGIRSPMIR